MLSLLLALGGCTTAPDRTAGSRAPVMPAETSGIKTALYAQYAEWQGTPYRLGGMSKRGIDCSGFVYATFLELFDTRLPRTTEAQAALGHSVSRDHIQAGDLVFFRTGRQKFHVGIYVENGRFLHASTSQGVTLSNINAPYWSVRYWKSRRLAETVAAR